MNSQRGAVRPSWRSASRSSTWAWIDTSSAETGSSQTSTSGRGRGPGRSRPAGAARRRARRGRRPRGARRASPTCSSSSQRPGPAFLPARHRAVERLGDQRGRRCSGGRRSRAGSGRSTLDAAARSGRRRRSGSADPRAAGAAAPRPASGSSRPSASRATVVLPEPDSPTMPSGLAPDRARRRRRPRPCGRRTPRTGPRPATPARTVRRRAARRSGRGAATRLRRSRTGGCRVEAAGGHGGQQQPGVVVRGRGQHRAVGPSSTIRPSFMTRTRSASRRPRPGRG